MGSIIAFLYTDVWAYGVHLRVAVCRGSVSDSGFVATADKNANSTGPVGKIWRPGRESISSACGALIALNNEIDSAQLSVGLDPMDTEMSLVRQSVLGKLSYGQQPNLIGITYAAHDCILESVKKTAKLAAPATSQYVIISGIQIHGALGKNYWWPGSITHVAGGVETDISGDYEDSVSDYRLDSWLKAEALSQVQQISGKSRVSGFFSDVV